MKNEKAAKSFVRKIIRHAKIDPYLCIAVDCPETGESFYWGTKESELLESIFGVESCYVRFVDLTTSRELGALAIFLDYDFDHNPEQIVYDYIDNNWTNKLMKYATKESK